MKRILLVFTLFFLYHFALAQNEKNTSIFTYKNNNGKISFVKDTLIITVINGDIHYKNNIYKFIHENVYLNDKYIGTVANNKLTLNDKVYTQQNDEVAFNWRYLYNNQLVLECFYRKDETDEISIGFVGANDSDLEILQAVALKNYSSTIKVDPDNDRLFMYIGMGVISSVVTFLVIMGADR